MMAGPLIILYEIGIIISRFAGKGKTADAENDISNPSKG
jgi:Sec-independent protein secretion pathway component TatC